jgi:hypothetical protein
MCRFNEEYTYLKLLMSWSGGRTTWGIFESVLDGVWVLIYFLYTDMLLVLANENPFIYVNFDPHLLSTYSRTVYTDVTCWANQNPFIYIWTLDISYFPHAQELSPWINFWYVKWRLIFIGAISRYNFFFKIISVITFGTNLKNVLCVEKHPWILGSARVSCPFLSLWFTGVVCYDVLDEMKDE